MAAEDEARAGRQALEDAYVATATRMLAEERPEEQPWWKVGLTIILVYAALVDEETGEERTPPAVLAMLTPYIRLKATQDHAALQFANAIEMGYPYLRWVAVLDGRTRASHRALHGTAQPVGTPWRTINGATLMFPGDASAPFDEWFNCRCVLVPSKRRTR